MVKQFRFGAIVAAAVALLISPSAGSAQDTGQRVRVTTAGGRLTGQVTATGVEGFDMAIDGGGARSVANADIVRLERSLGVRTNRTLGFLVGAGTGAAFGASFGLFAEKKCDDVVLLDEGCDEFGVFARILGGVAGGISLGLGGLLAGHVIKTERWERVPRPAGTATLSPLIDVRLGPASRPELALGGRVSF